ncbi:MAG: hypothetical protein COB12_05525 [Flavobacterium sp.]|nr:MAG: hypothetical protein COB12_05525 [Flavobacterium sp.]
MKTKNGILSFVFFTISFLVFSQDGVLDPSFGDNGIVTMDFYNYKDYSFGISQQNSGKIISTGQIETENDISQGSLVRFQTNGSLDTTFGNDGVVLLDLGTYFYYYNTIFSLDNDELIAGGTIGNWGEKDFIISKFMPNGDVDSGYGVNGNKIIDFLTEDDVLLQTIQHNGKTLAMGRSKVGSEYFISLAKLLPSGELDTDFGIDGLLTLDINEGYFNSFSASLQDDNSIILSFTEDLNSNNRANKIIKLLENGTIDNTFGNDGVIEILFSDVNNIRSTIEVDSNNKILFMITQDIELDVYSSSISRYTSTGNLDTTFGTNGFYNFETSFYSRKIIIQPNSRILIGGGIPGFESSQFVLKRLFDNGTIDNSLNENIYGNFENSDFILQEDGKILATGSTYWYDGPEDMVLVRYNNDPLSISDNNIKNLIVFPNPSKGIFNITHGFIVSETTYQILDITGKLIQQGNMSGEQTQLDISQFENGVYLFTSEGSTVRLIKN